MSAPGAGRDWDAASYDRVSDPQLRWAQPVLDRLAPRGDEAILDAGCGSGRVTALLLERIAAAPGTGGEVIAVDAAPSMVERARTALAECATVIHADLSELTLPRPVDAVFSNAVFHWIPDHERLFARLFATLRPGGRLVAQCGGAGNVERFHAIARDVAAEQPYAEHLAGWQGPWNFATPGATRERLARAGFEAIETSLEPAPVTPREPSEFLRTVCLRLHLEQLPEPLRDPYVAAVVDRHPQPLTLDYVRLNVDARRPR